MSGKKNTDPNPICDHEDRFQRRVTNIPDTVKSVMGMSLRSVWVCSRRACVLDAMAWVERAEAGDALIYNDKGEQVTA
jgi:hypothetical protein